MSKIPADSVGIVVPQDFRVPVGSAGWPLKSGAHLPELVIRYEVYGELSSKRDNVILVCAPLTADAHAAGFHSEQDKSAGWWEPLIGPGKAIDTRIYCVICSNNLAGCRGTTGPLSRNPLTGKPYGSSFPSILIDDMVNAQKALIEGLGIRKLAAVAGGSMGGFMAMKWAIEYPDWVDRCIIIASTTRLSGQALGFETVGRGIITADPAFDSGDYYTDGRPAVGQGPIEGLKHARKLAHITYLSALAMERKLVRFDADKRDPSKFRTGSGVEGYLNYQGDKFVERFDANSYLHITWAMDNFDLEHEYGSLRAAFSNVQCEVLNINLSSDWLFPPHESRKISQELLNNRKVVTSVELDSPYGHDGFLVEDMPEISSIIQRFLEEDHLDIASKQSAKPSLENLRATHEAIHAHEALQIFKDRKDFALVEKVITPGARVLDLGCGDGGLIDALWRSRGIQGVGMEKDLKGILGCLERDVPVLQADLDQGLAQVESDSFDFVILNRTLQEVRQPLELLREILRVGHKAIISFPNFGSYKVRGGLLFNGRMPMSENLPHQWHNTPNIHLFTLDDFKDLCAKDQIKIEALHCLSSSWLGRFLVGAGLPNLGAEQVVAIVGRGQS
jgi:homoserine O-acetyltransferase